MNTVALSLLFLAFGFTLASVALVVSIHLYGPSPDRAEVRRTLSAALKALGGSR